MRRTDTGEFSYGIRQFLSARSFAVVGASNDHNKFGYKCFDCYLRSGLRAYPINPEATLVLGHPVYKRLSELPERVDSVSIITPPTVTEMIVHEVIGLGIKNVWMQPGAESQVAVAQAEAAGLNVIHSGPCLLMELGYFAP